jgi:hypothetical protein
VGREPLPVYHGRDALRKQPVWLFLAKAVSKLACEQGSIPLKTKAFGVAQQAPFDRHKRKRSNSVKRKLPI